MKYQTSKRIIEKELKDLDVQPESDAWIFIENEAMAASDILNTKELKQLIEDHLEQFNFDQRGF